MPKNTFQLDDATVTEKRTLNFVQGGSGVVLTFVDDGDSGNIQFDLSKLLAISRGGSLYASGGLSAGADLVCWRAPVAATVTAVYGYRVGGTGATINARVNGTDSLLASDKSLTSADTWMDGGSVQNTAIAAGDVLEVQIVTVAGSPTTVAVQVDLTRNL